MVRLPTAKSDSTAEVLENQLQTLRVSAGKIHCNRPVHAALLSCQHSTVFLQAVKFISATLRLLSKHERKVSQRECQRDGLCI